MIESTLLLASLSGIEPDMKGTVSSYHHTATPSHWVPVQFSVLRFPLMPVHTREAAAGEKRGELKPMV